MLRCIAMAFVVALTLMSTAKAQEDSKLTPFQVCKLVLKVEHCERLNKTKKGDEVMSMAIMNALLSSPEAVNEQLTIIFEQMDAKKGPVI